MFYPEEMQKAFIAVHKSRQKQVIEELYRLRAVHVKEHESTDGFPIGFPLEGAEELSELLLRLKSIRAALGIGGQKAGAEGISIQQVKDLEKGLSARLGPLLEELKSLSDSLSAEQSKLESLNFLRRAGIKRLDVLREYEGLEIISGYARISELKARDCIAFIEKVGKEKAFVLFAKKKESGRIKERLAKAGFAEFRPNLDARGQVSEEIVKQEEIISRLLEKKSELEKKLAGMRGEYQDRVSDSVFWLGERLKIAELPLKLGASSSVVLISGWIPRKSHEAVSKALRKAAPNSYIRFEETDDAPTKMDNPVLVRPFEFFVNLYSTPAYREIDPSFLIFLTFPLFYGMILGDIGYGLIVLLLALGIRLGTGKARPIADVTILSALVAIAFGFLFGEFFGHEEVFGYPLEPVISRVHDLNSVLLLSVVIGLAHLSLGYIFAIKNEIGHNWKHAIFGKTGWLLVEVAFAFLLFDLLFKIRFLDTMASFGILAMGALLVALGEGVMYLIEIPSLLSNIVSYTRLAAFGLAGTSIAIVVNTTAGQMFESGGFMTVAGILVLVVGHAFNLALAMLDSFLQSLRLHYVEMFSKFYKGAGKAYRPFGGGQG
ncbi:MAG: hypothetical protein HYX24_04505 [Candidatus Aenigmarchaeota archaeon]|nr:hypothetical protein [Candidatus Aenigmarchaeota archaeon]